MDKKAEQYWMDHELYRFIKYSYMWQDGTHCGKQGNDVFRWSCFSGVLTMNV